MKLSLLMSVLLLGTVISLLPAPARATVSNDERAGDVLMVALPAAAYATTFYLDDEEGRMQFYKSFATTIVSVSALKYTVNARRPDGGSQSFPSWHTTSAFDGAAFLQRRYGWSYGLPSYLAASYVGWSRVHADRHYPRDVYAGAALALAANYYFVDKRPGAAPLVSFWSDGRSLGLALNGHW